MTGPCRCAHPATAHRPGAVTDRPGHGGCTHPGCGCRYFRTTVQARDDAIRAELAAALGQTPAYRETT